MPNTLRFWWTIRTRCKNSYRNLNNFGFSDCAGYSRLLIHKDKLSVHLSAVIREKIWGGKMRKLFLIARSNMRKAKGQTVAIVVLILLAAILLNLWLMLSMDYKSSAYLSCVSIICVNAQLCDPIITLLKKPHTVYVTG